MKTAPDCAVLRRFSSSDSENANPEIFRVDFAKKSRDRTYPANKHTKRSINLKYNTAPNTP